MSDKYTADILYMEDDEGLAMLFKKKLERAGYSVDIASNGKTGLRMIDTKPYRIIALDNKMPEYDGIDVLKILTERGGEHPPVIMITGTGNEEIAVQAMKLGASDYIIKDTDNRYFELLPSLIDKVLERKTLIAEKNRTEQALRESERRLREKNLIMEKDLKIAQTAQQAFLKREVPQSRFINLDYRYHPMYSVGGDYFSFLPYKDSGMGIFIGDVAGHGVASALFLALIKFATDSIFTRYGHQPAEYMKHLNNELYGYLSSYFITGIYGIFHFPVNADYTSFIFSNGGHPRPIVIDAGGEAHLLENSNTIIGAFENLEYSDSIVHLRKGDRMFLYTDGIPEAENEKNEIIGFDSDLVEFFLKSSRGTLGGTLDAIMEGVRGFCGTRKLSDDVVIIGVEVL